MEEMDFERRRELRRQKRDEMRLEAERMARTDHDEEEAARERRRRERQARLINRDSEEPSGQTDAPAMTNSHSVSESTSSAYGSGGGDDDEQALLERMAKREERRQRRLMEALERQGETDAQGPAPAPTKNNNNNNGAEEERRSSGRRGRSREDEEEKTPSRRREQQESREEEEEVAPQGGGEEEQEEGEEVVGEEEEQQKVEVEEEEEKPRRSYMREQESIEEANSQNQELAEEEAHLIVSESSNQATSTNSDADEGASEEAGEVPEDGYLDYSSENRSMALRNDSEEDNEVSETLHSEDNEAYERGGAREDRKQNGGPHAEPAQHRKPERTLSRGSVRSTPEACSSAGADGQDEEEDARLEAERKLEELRRRRDETESEEFERMRQKQQEAEAELEELKRKREDRRKVLEEEERQKKQEEADRKAREEEEKRKMKEEIERRRAEAAEKRQKVEDIVDGDGTPFKCVSPRGSSLKIGERAEFLNKSAQKSAVKASASPVVSKIDNRLEQYTSAAQRENKETRSPRSGATDLPLTTDIRNIKSMWEKGNAFSTPGSGGSPFKEAAVMKTGVAGRINDWLNKTPESGKAAGGKPTDLKPVDVTNKRSLWENKGASPTKVAGRGVTKSVANGMGH